MKVRIGATDNDGLGVLVRVQDDNNFYRINFSRAVASQMRPTRAMQAECRFKRFWVACWSEIFRDNQSTPLFPYLNGPVIPNLRNSKV